jgi:hypothetical protein
MARFLFPDDWVVSGVQIRSTPGFTGVIHRRDDVAAIWRWVCPHADHTTSEEARACAESKLGPDPEPVGIAPSLAP